MRINKVKFCYFITLLSLLVLLMGCVTTGTATVSTVHSAPEWVKKGAGFFMNDRDGAVIYGVGSIETTNPDGTKIPRSLLMRAAEARARASVINTMESKIEDLNKTFQQFIGEEDYAETQLLIEQSTTQSSARNLEYTPMIDSYFSESDGMQYVLVKYSPELYQAMIDNVGGVSSRIKKSVKDNARAVFEEMARMSKSNNQ